MATLGYGQNLFKKVSVYSDKPVTYPRGPSFSRKKRQLPNQVARQLIKDKEEPYVVASIHTSKEK